MPEVQWHSIAPAPVVLVTGKEPLLITRAVDRLKRLTKEADAGRELHLLDGPVLTKGEFLQVSAPSLFGEPRLVIIDEATKASEPVIDTLMDYVKQPEADVTLVLVHRGDQRAKKLLDAVKKSGAPWCPAAEIKKPKELAAFVMSEFSRAGRRINNEAMQALIDAFGKDLSELAAICQQLMSDHAGEGSQVISRAHVEALTAGRADTTGFAIADAAFAGRERDALALLRQAELSGMSGPAIVGSIAMKARQIAQVSPPGSTPKSAGMPDWMFRQAAQVARQFSPRALAQVFEELARADAAVKGQDRDPKWSVQRLVIEVARARRLR